MPFLLLLLASPAKGLAQCPDAIDILQPISCSGADDGVLSVTVPDGVDPDDVYWLQSNDTLFGPVQTNLGPGSYLVFIPGCSPLGTTLNEPFNFFISAAVTQLPTCDDPCSGVVTVTPNFGAEPITYAWSHDAVETGPVGTNICEQVVLVSATDANGCFDQDILIVDIPEVEVLTFPTPPSCFGFADGSVAAIATGGLGGDFEFEWIDASGNAVGNTAEVLDLPAGGYLVTATDTGGCSASEVAMLEAPPPVDVSMGAQGVSCFGASDGIAVASFSDAVDYAWSGPEGYSESGAELDTITGLVPGSYTVLVTAADGCVGEGSITVPSPDLLVAESFLDPPSCPGLSDGVVGVVIAGGTPDYLVEWTLPDGGTTTGQFLSGVPAGTYPFSLEDANGCVASGVAELSDPAPVSVLLDATDPLCAEGPLSEEGSIVASVMGGLAPYDAVWIDMATESIVATGLSATNLSEGTYGLGVSDALGCLLDTVIALTSPDTLTLSLDFAGPTCAGFADGFISGAASGGVPDYVYLWQGDVPPTIGAGVADLGSGSYDVEVTDGNGCQAFATVLLEEPDLLGLTLVASPVGCEGDDGSIQAAASGGTAPYSLVWTDESGSVVGTADTLDGVPAGIYTAQLSDSNACVAEESAEIAVLPPVELEVVSGPIDCVSGQSTVTISVAGGAEPLTLTLADEGGDIGYTAGMLLNPGSYTALVSDDRGCAADTTWILHPPVEVFLETSDEGCAGGGSIHIDVVGGNAEAGYTFNSPELGAPGLSSGLSATWEPVSEGSYTIEVGNEACTVIESVEVEGVALFDWAIGLVSFACPDAPGGIAVEVTGGQEPLEFSGQSSDGAVVWTTSEATGLEPGTYSVSVMDAVGCQRDTVLEVESAPPLSIVAAVQDISCYGAEDGVIDLEAEGGTPPLTLGAVGPSGPLPVPLVNLVAGVYVAGVIDGRGCTADTMVVISEPDPLVVETTAQTESCTGTGDGQALLTISGGTEPIGIEWGGGATENPLTGLQQGLYGWSVIDANNCDTSGTVEIDVAGELTAEAMVQPISCTDGIPEGAVVISLDGNGASADVLLGGLPADETATSGTGGTWTWIDLAAGAYGWSASLGEGCSTSGQVEIVLPDPLTFSAMVSPPSCEGGTGAFEGNPSGGTAPLTAFWSGVTTVGDTLSGEGPAAGALPEGTFTWSLVDDAGCSLDTTVVLAALSSGLSVTQELVQPSCGGALVGEAILQPSGGLSPYEIMVEGAADTTFLPFLVPGSYPLTVTDSVGCQFLDTIQIAPASDFILSAMVVDATCSNSEDGEILLETENGTGEVDFTFTGPFGAVPSGDTISDVGAGVYEVTAIDQAGCPAVLLVEVGAPPPVVVLLDSLDRPSCSGDEDGFLSVTVSGGAGPEYQVGWLLDGAPFGTGPTLQNLGEGQYAVEVLDAAGCAGSIASIPLVAEGDVELVVPSDTALCSGAPLSLEASATGATESYWGIPGGESGAGLSTGVDAVGEGTSYWLFTAIRLGCVQEDSVAVTGLTLPDPDAGEDAFIVGGTTTVLGVSGANEEWEYAWGPANGVESPTSASTVTTPLGETTTFILEATSVDGCTGLDTVIVEVLQELNIPSGFTPNDDGMNDRWNLGGLDQYPSAEITVFNRWGNVLFTQGIGSPPWDGTLNGIPVPVGTYYYHIRVNEPVLQTEWTGPITIMR